MVEEGIRSVVAAFGPVQAELLKLVVVSPAELILSDPANVAKLRHRLRSLLTRTTALDDAVGEWSRAVEALHVAGLAAAEKPPKNK